MVVKVTDQEERLWPISKELCLKLGFCPQEKGRQVQQAFKQENGLIGSLFEKKNSFTFRLKEPSNPTLQK